ncbi:hypothetical protein WJU23_20285 [Prosthecobacter sp. SYSU 5D2]|uniref:hypothetical protein n=1 Tax=Prosthecobacter sp. SYSU 5D2 TaxID=3134134 RepID=UPI0031FE64BA
MNSPLIFYQVLLVLAGIPAGWVIGWFYRRDLRKVERGKSRKTSLFATIGAPYLIFLPVLFMLGDLAYAFAGFMGLSLLTAGYSARPMGQQSP